MQANKEIVNRQVKIKGFSLIELMITMGLMVVVISVGLPNLTNQIERSEQTTFTRDFEKGITLARNEAITRQRQVGLYPLNGNWADGWQIRTIAETIPNVLAAEILYTSANSTQMSITSQQFTQATPLTFSPQGAVIQNGSFEIKIGSAITSTLSINIAGQLNRI